jgi:tRNA(Arg) A34 adenosine deaminase TadA
MNYEIVTPTGSRMRRAIKRAVEVAAPNDYQFRHGAVLFRGKRMHNTGRNRSRPVFWVQYQARPVGTKPESLSMHAEVSCMHRVPKDIIEGSNVLVVRLSKTGDLTFSKPCGTCQHEMKRKKIAKCYFSIDNERLGLMDFRG